jgi:hypothetical protein
MHGSGRMVVASSPMRRMRAHRLLRQFTKSACIETSRRYGSPDHHELRAGRGLVLRLSYRAILRRPEALRSTRASLRSTGAGTGRSRAVKLANAASRISGGSLASESRRHGGPRPIVRAVRDSAVAALAARGRTRAIGGISLMPKPERRKRVHRAPDRLIAALPSRQGVRS